MSLEEDIRIDYEAIRRCINEVKFSGASQPYLVLSCFNYINYDLEICKGCKFYDRKCKFFIDGFYQQINLN